MKILIAMDTNPYSTGIINDAAKLAANTWADVTMLITRSPTATQAGVDKTLTDALLQAQKVFFASGLQGEMPYPKLTAKQLTKSADNIWRASGRAAKELTMTIRLADPAKAILTEAREGQHDLIILGCGSDSQWQNEMDLPQRVARDADCSVLVIKETKKPEKIGCCLDQTHVSQESLEMINQIVTLHQADLKIVGLTGPKGLPGKGEVEKKMQEVLNYYTSRQINTLVKLVDGADLEEYAARATREGMIALWMGKKSLLGKLFPRDVVAKLLATSRSSVLILR